MKKRILIATIGLGFAALITVFGVQAYEAHKQAAQTQDAEADAIVVETWDDPWVQFHRQMRAMKANSESMFNEIFHSMATGDSFGQVKMDDQGDHYTVSVNLPSADQDNILVSLDGQRLNISASTNGQTERKDDNGQLIEQQSFTNSYQQILSLPGKVKADAMQSHFDKGVLTITVPKA